MASDGQQSETPTRTGWQPVNGGWQPPDGAWQGPAGWQSLAPVRPSPGAPSPSWAGSRSPEVGQSPAGSASATAWPSQEGASTHRQQPQSTEGYRPWTPRQTIIALIAAVLVACAGTIAVAWADPGSSGTGTNAPGGGQFGGGRFGGRTGTGGFAPFGGGFGNGGTGLGNGGAGGSGAGSQNGQPVPAPSNT